MNPGGNDILMRLGCRDRVDQGVEERKKTQETKFRWRKFNVETYKFQIGRDEWFSSVYFESTVEACPLFCCQSMKFVHRRICWLCGSHEYAWQKSSLQGLLAYDWDNIWIFILIFNIVVLILNYSLDIIIKLSRSEMLEAVSMTWPQLNTNQRPKFILQIVQLKTEGCCNVLSP